MPKTLDTTIKNLDILLARTIFSGFVMQTMAEYIFEEVHYKICAELDVFFQDVVSRKSPRLMLCLPPRHGKTELASRRFPAYALGRNPDLSLIAASYSADLSGRINKDVQRIIDSDAYRQIFPATKLPSGKKYGEVRTSELFEIDGKKGVYRSAGVGGGITGMGADIAIIDDPFKDRASADSHTIRDNVWDWYTSTLYTRLSAGGGVLIINTRWHEDDLSGRLLAAANAGTGDKWRVVNFPAIATCDEEFRNAGEALSPERFPLDKLLDIKRAIGTRDWEALYQQHPTVEGGAIFKQEWFKFYTTLPQKFDTVIQSWDMTFKDGDNNDFVVGQVWGRRGGDLYLIDQVRGRWGFTETLLQFERLCEKYPYATRKLIEDKANGPAVIDVLKHKIHGIIPVEPDGSKIARAHAVTAVFESGNVYIPDVSIAPWVQDYTLELTQFPTGAHDDCVDSSTQGIRDLTSHSPLRINISHSVQMFKRF